MFMEALLSYEVTHPCDVLLRRASAGVLSPLAALSTATSSRRPSSPQRGLPSPVGKRLRVLRRGRTRISDDTHVRGFDADRSTELPVIPETYRLDGHSPQQ